MRVNQSDFESLVAQLEEGKHLNLLISRDDVLMEIQLRSSTYERPSYKFSAATDEKNNAKRDYWLRTE